MSQILEEIRKIFDGYLDKEQIELYIRDFEDIKDIPLRQLGIDSLALMGIVINIETAYEFDIDLENFDIKEIETLEKILNFVKRIKGR